MIEENEEEMDITEAVDSEVQELDVSLYSVDLQVQTREFKGQISGMTKSALAISCNSVDEFKQMLWQKIRDKLKREVVFSDNDPEWHENTSPKEEDMERFILFYDPKSKRSVMLNKVTTVTLNHWRSKEIWLYIHVYSTSISNLTMWKRVQKSLIEPLNRDRAGASSVSEVNSLVSRLKEIHRYHYQSSQINWMMWANRIQGSEAHQREKMINSPPPADMLHLFAVAKTSSDDKISELRQNLCVAENVNDGATTVLTRIRSLVDSVRQLQKTIVELQKELDTKIDLLEHEVASFEKQTTTTQSLLKSMELAMPPVETNFGHSLLQQIQEQDDVDHI